MWSRRAFLQNSSLALAAMTALETHAAASERGPLGRPIGIQVWTVRDAFAKDPIGTLQHLAKIGYREIELAGGPPPRPGAELKQVMSDNGLTCPSIHSSMAELQSSFEQKLELANAVGAHYLVCAFPWTADSRFKAANAAQGIAAGMTLDDWRWNADELNRMGELARKSGVRMGYHNHNMEFRSFAGAVAFDELLRETDPMLVTIELDIAWVVTAGVDPLLYLTRHADRVSLLHVKEVRKDAQTMTEKLQAQTTELGAGKIDWPKLFKAMNPNRIRHYFVEQENFERPPLESVKMNFDYLKSLKS